MKPKGAYSRLCGFTPKATCQAAFFLSSSWLPSSRCASTTWLGLGLELGLGLGLANPNPNPNQVRVDYRCRVAGAEVELGAHDAAVLELLGAQRGRQLRRALEEAAG
jgi:hypothetical protein